MMKLKPLVAALLLAPLSCALGFPAEVERNATDELLVSWDNGTAPLDVWVEYHRDGNKVERQLVSQQDSDGKHQFAANDTRPYVVLVTADGHEQVVAERVLPLEGGNNFRDLGGYETTDGRHVKWGSLFRSGTMVGLTASDYDYLGQLGIRTVCDFRSTEERTSEPTTWQGEHKPARKETDYVMDNMSLMKEIAQPGLTPEQARGVFAGFYREVPFTFTTQYREMFAELVAGHAPLAFNCSAGKDRTGVGSALLLSALGVKHEQVVADYLLSNRYYKPAPAKPGAQDSTSRMLAALSPEVVKVLMGVDASYIEASLASINERYGSLEKYLDEQLGVDAADLAILRSLYTE